MDQKDKKDAKDKRDKRTNGPDDKSCKEMVRKYKIVLFRAQ